ncbi:FtsX-like permease family protein [Pedobacter sp. HMF7647]|uniref:FtsX-like permease family protein n=1 Tax=Hufsiella arboris TaxID=2695275 RepID=A0A7K1YA60_9SPHI|nr:ABC transporter permease [Hufsiella arboris]MXV51475.1 FtsX-like permease family protein [Hufsiella arboris]
MFRNYLKISWRNITANRQFTFLNLIGLSAGLASAILVYIWISDELHINKFNQNDDRVYQVMQSVSDGNGAIENTPGLLADALQIEMPEVEYAASVIPSTWFAEKGLFSFNDTHIRADGQFVSNNYFSIFPCSFIEGNANQLFSSKNNLAISKQLALKIFGTTNNVIGKTIEWNQQGFNENYIVTGIFEKQSSNSTIQFDAVFNYAQFLDKNSKLLKWTNNDPYTYVLLKKKSDAHIFSKKIAGFVKTKNADSKQVLFAQLFSDTYLYNRYVNGVPSGGRIEYVKLFFIITIFILLIACINFMNLSTARALKRIKEIGIQKIVGASRRSLIIQYLSESILMAFLSLFLAIAIVIILLPAFKQLTGKDFNLQFDTNFILAITTITLITGIIAGSYPAFYLSHFKPVLVLKGALKNTIGELWMRKGLVVFQFTVSVVLIISVMIVYQQMQLIETTNLGYERDHVIYFDKGGKLSANDADFKQGAVYKDLETFLQQIKTIPGVANASNFRHSIVNREGGTTDVIWQGKPADDQTSFTDIACGYNFIETLGIQMKEGRPYSTAFGSDDDKVVLNEAAVKAMGLIDPVGKNITIWGNKKQIIGVTKNFHFQSLYENIKPCFFDLSMNARVSKIAVRIKAGNEKATIEKLLKFYKSYTGEALNYAFVDEDYEALYASEQRVAALSKYFAGIAIIISCLGLFGLAAFTAQKRRKEIGIRKVIGASVSSIIAMLSKDFLKLVLLAVVIAFPVSWWLMNNWLQSFAYRIQISVYVYLIAAISVIVITIITISFQSIKAAIANPVKSLRTE